MATQEPIHIDFHFDPACPLAWRTALWIREARNVRPIDITWRFFSLEVVNRKPDTTPNYATDGTWASERVLALVRDKYGNEAVERLYIALGNARHGRGEDIKKPEVIRAALQEAGLQPGLLDEALADETTIEDVLRDHQEAVRRYHAFGVPTIAIQGSNVGFYGPIIHTVPRGEEAGELWDWLYYALQRPNIFELKRERVGVKWEPVSA